MVFGRFIKAAVLFRLIRVFYTEPRNLQRGMRHAVSENKRRYRFGAFDLDLTFITPKVIGMSFPSSGKMALYRNNIKDVAKFFDQQYGPGKVKVYNLCSEKDYDTSYFHGKVARYSIDDHNVPSLDQMIDFVNDVKQWLEAEEGNLIAVHCKGWLTSQYISLKHVIIPLLSIGGKGRTGTMICAWLMFNGQFHDSKDVVDFFGERRTDKSVGSKYQGVETPSQSRYIDYFHQVLTKFGGTIPAKLPIVLKSIKISALAGIGAGDGSDFSCSIFINKESTFICDFGNGTNCHVDYNPEQDNLIVTPMNCPTLIGDIRIKFNCKNKSVPKAYEECAFYFWFNTSFVDMKAKKLSINRNMLDNPHKQKTWKLYREKFAVELTFNDYQN